MLIFLKNFKMSQVVPPEKKDVFKMLQVFTEQENFKRFQVSSTYCVYQQ